MSVRTANLMRNFTLLFHVDTYLRCVDIFVINRYYKGYYFICISEILSRISIYFAINPLFFSHQKFVLNVTSFFISLRFYNIVGDIYYGSNEKNIQLFLFFSFLFSGRDIV